MNKSPETREDLFKEQLKSTFVITQITHLLFWSRTQDVCFENSIFSKNTEKSFLEIFEKPLRSNLLLVEFQTFPLHLVFKEFEHFEKL